MESSSCMQNRSLSQYAASTSLLTSRHAIQRPLTSCRVTGRAHLRGNGRNSSIKERIASVAALPDSTEVVIVGAGKLKSSLCSQMEACYAVVWKLWSGLNTVKTASNASSTAGSVYTLNHVQGVRLTIMQAWQASAVGTTSRKRGWASPFLRAQRVWVGASRQMRWMASCWTGAFRSF